MSLTLESKSKSRHDHGISAMRWKSVCQPVRSMKEAAATLPYQHWRQGLALMTSSPTNNIANTNLLLVLRMYSLNPFSHGRVIFSLLFYRLRLILQTPGHRKNVRGTMAVASQPSDQQANETATPMISVLEHQRSVTGRYLSSSFGLLDDEGVRKCTSAGTTSP